MRNFQLICAIAIDCDGDCEGVFSIFGKIGKDSSSGDAAVMFLAFFEHPPLLLSLSLSHPLSSILYSSVNCIAAGTVGCAIFAFRVPPKATNSLGHVVAGGATVPYVTMPSSLQAARQADEATFHPSIHPSVRHFFAS